MKKKQLNRERSGGLRLLSVLLAIVMLCGLVIPGGAMVMNTYADEVEEPVVAEPAQLSEEPGEEPADVSDVNVDIDESSITADESEELSTEKVAPAEEEPVSEEEVIEVSPVEEDGSVEEPADVSDVIVESDESDTTTSEEPKPDASTVTVEAVAGTLDAAEPETVSPVDELFNRLMACETYEELDAAMEAMTEEEYELLYQFSDEQNAALQDRVAELSETSAEVLDTVTVDEVLETYEHTASGNRYQTSRVYLAVRNNGDIPGEPSDQGSAAYTFYNSSYSGGFSTFASNPTGIIDENIVDYQNFIFTSVDGTDTAGLVDATGTTTNQVLSGIDFDRLLNAIANRGETKATDGVTVKNSNKDNYKVVCYVIKLQLDVNHGWHIDCAVVPKTYVTLSYDINIPDGYVITTDGVGVPNSETGAPPATFTVGDMDGLTTIEGQTDAINVESADGTEQYVFMFQGWNTKADGTGVWYDPDEDITINENTVLYAIWNSNPALGTGNLEIQKIVNVDPVPTDAVFTFRVNIKNADGTASTDSYDYVIYNANTIAQSRGTITNGGTIELKHTQYVEIQDLPAVNEENGTANITVTEINYDGYAPSWDGGTIVSDTTTVTIQGGRDSRVTCTNSVAAPETTDVTIEKIVDGNLGDWTKDFTFTVTYADGTNETFNLKNEGTKLLEGVLLDSEITIAETNADGYTTSVTTTTAGETSAETALGANRTYTVTVTDELEKVTFINTKDAPIDTGVALDALPYVLILAVAAVGVVAMVIRKRRVTDED